MANEAVIIELGIEAGNPVRRTVAAGTSISKGTICYLTDPNTAVASATATIAQPFAGIAAADKDGADPSTNLSFYTRGVFDLKTGTLGIGVGDLVVISGANLIKQANAADILSGAVIGRCEEAAAASEVVRVRLGL